MKDNHPSLTIEDHSILSKEEEKELIEKYQQGDKKEKEEVKRKMLKYNQKLIADRAYKMIKSSYNADDELLSELYQEGSKGIEPAMENFELERDVKFSTYAIHWIDQKMFLYIRDKKELVRTPAYIQEIIRKLDKYLEEEEKDIMELDIERASSKLGITEKEVKRAAKVRGRVKLSTERLEEEKGYRVSGRKGEHPDTQAIERDIRENLDRKLEELDDRAAKILKLRYFKDKTLKEISESLDPTITKERVRQIEKESLEKLQDMMDEENFL